MSVYHVYRLRKEMYGPTGQEVPVVVHVLVHTSNDKTEACEFAARNYSPEEAYVVEAPERRARGYRRRKS